MSQDFSSTSSVAKSASAAEGRVFSIASMGSSVDVDVADETESVIESNPAVQGGDYCFRGTRITVGGIVEAMREKHTIKEMVGALKKYWGFSISEEALKRAIDEYESIVQGAYR